MAGCARLCGADCKYCETSYFGDTPVVLRWLSHELFLTYSLTYSVENQSDEVDGLGSVSVWSGGMDIKEIG